MFKAILNALFYRKFFDAKRKAIKNLNTWTVNSFVMNT
jgi:hypothetical protein